MIAAVLVVLAAELAYAALGLRLTRLFPPAAAVRLLVPAGLAVSAAVWFVLAVAAFTWLGQDREIAALRPWSPQILRAQSPIPRVPAMAAFVILLAAIANAIVVVARRARLLLDVHRACSRVGVPGSLVILDSDVPDAFTTPGATGRIVVTRGMLRALSADEQAALLAQERSHLVHRHAWWALATDAAAAAIPLLSHTSRAIRLAMERWADEDAAQVLADRHVVARAIARAALARNAHHRTTRLVTAATDGDVATRIRALLTPPASHRSTANHRPCRPTPRADGWHSDRPAHG